MDLNNVSELEESAGHLIERLQPGGEQAQNVSVAEHPTEVCLLHRALHGMEMIPAMLTIAVIVTATAASPGETICRLGISLFYP